MRYVLHDPDARLDYWWDWTAWLAPGETITAATVDTDDATLTVEAPAFINGGRVGAWISDGTSGTKPCVTAHITTDKGRQDERTYPLQVQHR